MLIKDIFCFFVTLFVSFQLITVNSFIMPPIIMTSHEHINIDAGSNFIIRCLGNLPMRWKMQRNSENAEFPENVINNATYHPPERLFTSQCSLNIVNATYNNTGNYTCFYNRKNFVRIYEASVYIFVNDPNNLLITEFMPTQPIFVYKNSKIPCLPTISKLNVTLWKQGKYVPQHVDDITFNPTIGFNFVNPTQYFNGLFTCKASYRNHTQEISFSLISVKVKLKKPVLNVGSIYNVKAGSTLRLNCTGDFPLEWKLPNHSNPDYKEGYNITHHNFNIENKNYVTELTINDIKFFQTGPYRCCYQHPYCLSDDDKSDVYIFVNDPQELFVRDKTKDYKNKKEYRCVTDFVPCLPTFSDLKVTLWSGKNNVHTDNNTVFDPTRGFILHKTYYQSLSLLYTCKAEYATKKQEIKISSLSIDNNKDMGIYVYASNLYPVEEEEVEIVCEICIYKNDSISWVLDKKIITDQNELGITIIDEITTVSKKRTLKFKSVKTYHSGIYSCVRFSKDGTFNETKSIALRITALQKPFFISTNMNKSKVALLPGDRHEFHCLVEGIPLPSISWYKNDKLIVEDFPGVVFEKRSQILTIDPIIGEDEGVFKCIAENRRGFIEIETILTVKNANGDEYYSDQFLDKSSKLSKSEIFLISLFVILLIVFSSSLYILVKNIRKPQVVQITDSEEEMCIPEMMEIEPDEDDNL